MQNEPGFFNERAYDESGSKKEQETRASEIIVANNHELVDRYIS